MYKEEDVIFDIFTGARTNLKVKLFIKKNNLNGCLRSSIVQMILQV